MSPRPPRSSAEGPPNFLALDTSTRTAGVAVSRAGRVEERRSQVTTHSEMLLSLIDETLRAVGLSPGDLDGIACGAGPGSFTGLRIGLATAKGLCFALDRPLVLISSLEALAARAPAGSRVVAAIDAYKGEIYAARFEVAADGLPQRQGEERAVFPAELAREMTDLIGQTEGAPLFVVGEGALKYPQLVIAGAQLLDDDPSPRPADLLRLAHLRFLAGDVEDLAASVPRYLRASEAERAKLRREKLRD